MFQPDDTRVQIAIRLWTRRMLCSRNDALQHRPMHASRTSRQLLQRRQHSRKQNPFLSERRVCRCGGHLHPRVPLWRWLDMRRQFLCCPRGYIVREQLPVLKVLKRKPHIHTNHNANLPSKESTVAIWWMPGYCIVFYSLHGRLP